MKTQLTIFYINTTNFISSAVFIDGHWDDFSFAYPLPGHDLELLAAENSRYLTASRLLNEVSIKKISTKVSPTDLAAAPLTNQTLLVFESADSDIRAAVRSVGTLHGGDSSSFPIWKWIEHSLPPVHATTDSTRYGTSDKFIKPFSSAQIGNDSVMLVLNSDSTTATGFHVELEYRIKNLDFSKHIFQAFRVCPNF